MFFNIFKREPKPFNEGYLPEASGHKVYFREFGNPKGKAILSFHGGPGYYSQVKHAGIFDLKKYRVILFDQRGSGKSMPVGEMKNNTTEDILLDAKRLLDFLNIKGKIILSGNSWGSTLVLLFAQKYPKIVEKMIISKIFLADKMNLEWCYNQTQHVYPDMFEKMLEGADGKKNFIKQYQKMINSRDMEKQVKTVSLFSRYEWCLSSMNPSLEFDEISIDEIEGSKIYINYLANNFFIKDNQILDNMKNIKDIKTLILHNRLDLVCPLKNAYMVHKSLPKSKLVIVPSFGHSSEELSKTTKKEIKNFL